MKEYSFKYQNKIGIVYLLTVLIGIPFLIIAVTVWLMDYISWLFWVSVPVMILTMILGVWRFLKKSRTWDTIQLDNDGFTSKSYGRVEYQEIADIPAYSALIAPPPSMRIRLTDGRQLIWLFNPNNLKSTNDINTFIAFKEDLLDHLEQRELKLTKKVDNTSRDLHEIQIKEDLTNKKIDYDIIAQLKESKQRDYRFIAIPISAIFATIMLLKTCGTDFIRSQRENESNNFRSAVLKIETNYDNNVQRARDVAARYAIKFGPVFLLTNDPDAVLEFTPNINKDPYSTEINVIGLRRVEDNRLLEQYIKHPDSVSYELSVVNETAKFYSIMRKSILAHPDSSSGTIYFAVYNPKESFPVKHNRTSSHDNTFRPIQFATSITLPSIGKLTKDILHNMDFASLRSILQSYKGTYFYMVAKEQDGISESQFAQIKSLVEQDLKEHQIDTKSFQSKVYNVR
ncbi:hypothetical protein [Sphingobacterium zeae]|uniref:Uncharacterized protein n=1 Tax=Sphingobacterium zeae TaxID=1776859 RepID=A0ABU0U7R5_9SPHI|nr:hypothetical protein [Sphingobacterium zeae]MDQ1150994.1 hypothetical protein [Sphingobacterium zeae]